MNYFKLNFRCSPAQLGSGTEYVTRRLCVGCNRKTLPFLSNYPVPEDEIITLALDCNAEMLTPLFEASGLLIVDDATAAGLCVAGVTGITRECILLRDIDTGQFINGFNWIKVRGRCNLLPIWNTIVGTCPVCGVPITEPFASTVRSTVITSPKPTMDFVRGRERPAGVLVSHQGVNALRAVVPDFDSYAQVSIVEEREI